MYTCDAPVFQKENSDLSIHFIICLLAYDVLMKREERIAETNL